MVDSLRDQVRVHGEGHPETLDTRYQVAYWMEDLSESLAELESVLAERSSVLGPYHADTIGTRREVARRTWVVRGENEGRPLFESLLKDLRRDLGPGHALTRKLCSQCERLINELRAGKNSLQLAIDSGSDPAPGA
jgi:hypothetical protein